MPQPRQLAAIMFTDIVGYTALMGNDEQKAFEILKNNREIHQPVIELYHGKLIKELGDGILASFSTASDALMASIKIQQACSSSTELTLRIGIHEGEIIFENNDIYGDAVNIASRIQTLGVPGSILFSKKVADEIRNKAAFHAVSLGSFEFKNVEDPIEVFALANDGFPVPKRSRMDGKLKKKNVRKRNAIAAGSVVVVIAIAILIYYVFIIKKDNAEITGKSIAVLSFTDMSKGKDQEYLGDGIADNIITSLSGIKDLKVIGRTSSFSFKEKNEDSHSIGEKLGVATLLEGSVQRDGNKIRVTAQLIRTIDGSHIWSEKYDRDFESIFKLQDDIAGAVVKQLRLKFLNTKSNAFVSSTNTDAYNLILQGNYFAEKRDKENMDKALDFYLKALSIDSSNARSWAAVANYYNHLTSWGLIEKNLGVQKAREAATTSVELDGTQAVGHQVLGEVKLWDFDWDGAEAEFQMALNLEPGNADLLRIIGILYRCTGRFEEGIRLTKQSINYDPVRPISYFNYGHLLLYANHLEEALAAYKKVLELNTQFPRTHIFIGIIYLLQGKPELALPEMPQEANEAWRAFGLILTYQALGRKEEVNKMVSDFIAKFQKEEIYQIAQIYAFRGEKDKAFEWLEKSYAARYIRLNFFKGDPLLKNLEGDPRHTAFLKKMNLPID